jgi:hypothetical protein
MADPIEQLRQKLLDRIARIIDDHRATSDGAACTCGADEFTGHSHHVAEQIAHELGLMPSIDDVKKRIRYTSAVLDWELTKLEGAQY